MLHHHWSTTMKSVSLGTQIRQARKNANMTQGDVAEKLSISVQAVSQWETDKTIPTFSNLRDLKTIIGLEIDKNLSASDFLLHRHMSFDDEPVAVRAPLVPWKNPEQWANTELDWKSFKSDQFTPDEFFEVKWTPKGEVYALKARDNSLQPEFSRGDHIIIDTGRAAEKGDIVVAEIESKGVVWGRYHPLGFDQHRAPIFELRNNLKTMEPFVHRVDTDNPGRVLGVVREHRRYFRND